MVCAAGRETVYRRAGKGEPVLFLIEEGGSPAPESLLRALVAKARVLVVSAPRATDPRDPPSSRWLLDFLDTLALDQVAVVCVPGAAPLARALAAESPERVTRLALLDEMDAVAQAATA